MRVSVIVSISNKISVSSCVNFSLPYKFYLTYLEELLIIEKSYKQAQVLLKTSDYLFTLDLIDSTQEIISTQLNDLPDVKYYAAQFNELHLSIVHLLRIEFEKCLDQLLTQQGLDFYLNMKIILRFI
jgi:hypothetical protein